jgi:uncharacterized protein (DUF697 family)
MAWTYVALLATARACFSVKSAMMAVTGYTYTSTYTTASADVVNDDIDDLTTPLSHETIRSSIDARARELAQTAAL